MKSQKLYRLFGELRQEFPDSIEAAEDLSSMELATRYRGHHHPVGIRMIKLRQAERDVLLHKGQGSIQRDHGRCERTGPRIRNLLSTEMEAAALIDREHPLSISQDHGSVCSRVLLVLTH